VILERRFGGCDERAGLPEEDVENCKRWEVGARAPLDTRNFVEGGKGEEMKGKGMKEKKLKNWKREGGQGIERQEKRERRRNEGDREENEDKETKEKRKRGWRIEGKGE
jgi:hypothetical protein